MNIFALIASIINKILSFGLGGSSAPSGTPQLPEYGGEHQTAPTPPKDATSAGKRHLITIPETVTAHFYDTGSSAWVNQVFTIGGKTYRGIHGGTDFSAPKGSPVYAAYDMSVIVVGHYSDAGRMGDYVIGTLNDGVEYYSGHLDNVRVSVGEHITGGTQIGQTNVYNHTHIQLKRNGEVIDPEEYFKVNP